VATLKGLVLAAASVGTVIKVFDKLYDVTKEYQVLEAQIRTATGSIDGSHDALLALHELAKNTPFTLTEMTNAFTGLVNKGLDPSAKALTAYGNIATAMNISLDTVTGAIISSSSGMYRSLMSIGVKAKETADGLVLTYHGVSTKIRKDSADIEAYVQNLGNTHFADAMTARAATLEGATHRLQEAWDELFISISERGAGRLIADSMATATKVIEDLTALIASGQLAGYVDALRFKFSSLTDGITNAIANITDVIETAYKYWSTDGRGVVDFLIHAFKEWPENVRACVQAIGASFGYMYTVGQTIWEGIVTVASKALEVMVANAQWAGTSIWSALKDPSNAGKYLKDFVDAASHNVLALGVTTVKTYTNSKQKIGDATDALKEEIASIMNERDARLTSFTAQINAADILRAKYDALKAAKDNSNKDPLAGFKPAQGSTHINSPADIAAFEALKKELQLEETAISESYRRRHDLIVNNTKGDAALQEELLKELDSRVTGEYEKAFQDRGARLLKIEDDLRTAIAAGRISEVEMLQSQLETEQQHVQASYLQRRQDILNNTKLTETQRLALLTQLEAKYTQQTRDQDLARQKATLSTTADFFGNMAAMAGAFGAKGAKIAKAAAIIQATIKTYESATSAYAALAGIPYIGPVLGAAAAGAAIAAGMANIAAIKAQNYTGAYATGGMIPGGSVGLVGETGKPELVSGPAIVTSAQRTADLVGNSAGQQVNIIINNNAPVEVVKQSDTSTQDGRTVQFIVRQAVSAVASDIDAGAGPVTNAAQRRWNVRRGAA
jgi:hypothetical protein